MKKRTFVEWITSFISNMRVERPEESESKGELAKLFKENISGIDLLLVYDSTLPIETITYSLIKSGDGFDKYLSTPFDIELGNYNKIDSSGEEEEIIPVEFGWNFKCANETIIASSTDSESESPIWEFLGNVHYFENVDSEAVNQYAFDIWDACIDELYALEGTAKVVVEGESIALPITFRAINKDK